METLLDQIIRIEPSSFLSSFLSALFAGGIIAILFSILLPKILISAKKPKVDFLTRGNDRGQNVEMTLARDGGWESTVLLRIENNGKEALSDYYWHLLIPSELNPETSPTGNGEMPGIETIGEWSSWSGNVSVPVFPDSSYKFPFEIKIKSPTEGEWVIHYWFNTAFGAYPLKAKSVTKDEKKFQEALDKGQLGKINVHSVR